MCQQYCLPDPLLVLQSQPSKESWKRICKGRVVSWWEAKLRAESTLLPSLVYFFPFSMSLTSPHPIWSMAESPFEVSKASTVAVMLSGRYVTDHRARYWSRTNPEGFCQLCLVNKYDEVLGTLEHLLLRCPALSETRSNAVSHWAAYLSDKPFLFPIVSHHTTATSENCDELKMRLLLDPSSLPTVIRAVQELGPGVLSHLLYLGRTWCHSHRMRRKILVKLYNII